MLDVGRADCKPLKTRKINVTKGGIGQGSQQAMSDVRRAGGKPVKTRKIQFTKGAGSGKEVNMQCGM